MMHSGREGHAVRAIGALAVVAAVIAAIVYSNFGTLSPCGVLRETVRQRDGLAAVLPDSIVDLAISAQYGALSPGRCMGILLEQQSAPTPNTAQASRQQAPQTARPPLNGQDALRAALKETEQAAIQCR